MAIRKIPRVDTVLPSAVFVEAALGEGPRAAAPKGTGGRAPGRPWPLQGVRPSSQNCTDSPESHCWGAGPGRGGARPRLWERGRSPRGHGGGGWRSSREAAGRKNWGNVSGKGGWRRLQWAAGSEHEGPASHLGPGEGPHSVPLASTLPICRKRPPACFCAAKTSVSWAPHCVHHKKNGNNPVKEVELPARVPAGPEPDHLPLTAPAVLGNCILPSQGKAQRVTARKGSPTLPGTSFRPNCPQGREGKGTRYGSSPPSKPPTLGLWEDCLAGGPLESASPHCASCAALDLYFLLKGLWGYGSHWRPGPVLGETYSMGVWWGVVTG